MDLLQSPEGQWRPWKTERTGDKFPDPQGTVQFEDGVLGLGRVDSVAQGAEEARQAVQVVPVQMSDEDLGHFAWPNKCKFTPLVSNSKPYEAID